MAHRLLLRKCRLYVALEATGASNDFINFSVFGSEVLKSIVKEESAFF